MAASLYVGLMSGTSADGIDACLAEFDGDRCREHGHVHCPFEPALRERVLAVARGASLDEAATLDFLLAAAYADAVRQLLDATGTAPDRIRAIGCHGQTVLHRPSGDAPTTVQLGDPHRLAALCGIDVVADFRRADMAAGGQGAPLAPAFHGPAFGAADEDRCVLNLGGIGNLTVLPAGSDTPRLGFDTGPANVLLDLWSAEHGHGEFDAGGAWAASGRVDAGLLERLRTDPWFRDPPPKSTGRELFEWAWLERQGGDDLRRLEPADVQATLAELTATTIADAVRVHAPATARLIVSGGGARNADLLARLARLLPGVAIDTTADHGIEPEHVEALAFAWLARRRLHDLPGNCPAVTGARREVPLGAVIRAPR
ncbi:MAG: anhydro-N-acetylmuramic acid kinase [Halofilum sp. (in: g-proteobacteria)]|nr:anhydro-N-acetylmuramic acid kinase [Halofilum sp. (in: g-proteobacteria)]